ncbi:MAG TPA: MG2 domain-containing protein, partial [Longimicrobium sp.]|nr:MG2 domain-containing protein [Longimicrobium sp.]
MSHDHRALRVRIHRVRPEDWPVFTELYGPWAPFPGTEVVNRIVRIDARAGEMTETVIDLDEALGGKPGQLVVGVESVETPNRPDRHQHTYAWVQSTRIGLAAFVEPRKATAWATSLVDGRPLSGLRLTGSGGGDGTTDADGVASVPLPATTNAEWLAVRGGDDVALLPGPWYRADPATELRFWAATDRNLYRPGEEVRFKGWVRRAGPAPEDGLALPRRLDDSVTWRAFDPRGSEIATGRAPLTSLGGFDGRFAVPAGANLGYGRIELTLAGQPDGGQGHAGFRVEEFRRPEYEVSAEADEGPHVAGGSAEVSVRASYFSGGALPGAPVRWWVTTQPGYFTPPGWDAWRFGVQGGWHSYGSRARVPRPPEELQGETDIQGRHGIRVHFDGPEPPQAYTVTAQATVTDVNRQPWSTQRTLLVHPGEIYVGLRTEQGWLRAGEPIELSIVTVGLDGKPVPERPVALVATRLEWRSVGHGWSEVATDSTRCAVVTGVNPVTCTFATDARGGRYRIDATVRDAQDRPSQTRMDVWAYGGGPWMRGPGEDAENPERRVTLVADRATYAPGDTAQVLVQLPFWPARGVATLRRGGIVRTQAVASDGPTFTVPVVVGEDDFPALTVQVDVVGAHDAAGRRQPTARGTDFAS